MRALCQVRMFTESHDPVAVVFTDLDDFKEVNDRYGHVVGDQLLIATAELISRGARRKGTAYRIAGDEFLLVLENYDADEGAALAERLRKVLQATPLTSYSIKITGSFGVASSPEHGSDPEQLFDCADRALFEAKRMGGNRVRIFRRGKFGDPGDDPPVTPLLAS